MDDVPAGFLADPHVAPPSPHRAMLWYAAECGQRHLSLAKFMRLGPLESDSYTATAMTKHSLYNFSSNKEANLKA